MKKLLIPFVLLLLTLTAACANIPDTGQEGAPCFSKGFCLDNLVCSPEKICVKPASSDGGDAGVDAGSDTGEDSGLLPDASTDGGADTGVDTGTDATSADSGDGGSSDTAEDGGSEITISDIDPANPYVTVTKTKQFNATVSGTEDKTVIWSATAGIIDGNGYFTAPPTPMDITIMAKANAKQSVFKQTTVHVVGVPAITSFSANPDQVLYGGTSTLTAVFANGDGAVDNSIGEVISGTGKTTAPIVSETIYKLTVTNLAGATETKDTTVTVQTVSISDISPADPNVTVLYQKQFSATVTDAVDTSIDWTATCGSIVGGLYTAPDAPATCEITAASHADPTKWKKTGVSVFAEPQITSFTASPDNPVPYNSTVTLGATFKGGTGSIDQGMGSITSGGTKTYNNIIDDRVFTLTVTNPAKTVTQGVNVYVTPQDVTNLAGKIEYGTAVTLTWTDPAHPVPDHIEITWSPGAGSITVAKGLQTAFISGLTDPGTYTFTVKTVDLGGFKSSGVSVDIKPSDYCLTSQCFPVPPTGQTKCYNDTVEITCPTNRTDAFWGQDAQFQKARTLTCSGGACSTTVAVDGEVVTDSLTGLVWQRTFADGKTWQEADDYCDLEYGGYQDWALPSPFELSSIVDNQKFIPAIDTTIFPGTTSAYYYSSSFNTSSTSAIWYVDFSGGDLDEGGKDNPNNVRCVRSQPVEYKLLERYMETEPKTGEKIVTDNITALTWQFNTVTLKKWSEALSHCATVDYGNFQDWRLPNRNELMSLANYSRYDPASDFPSMPLNDFWSSSSYVNGISEAWVVNFYSGYVKQLSKNNTRNVRCVRDGMIR